MYIVIFCSLLALLFTYLESTGQFKKGMLWGFMLVTLLQVVHYDYGNDYMPYYYGYLDIIRTPFNWENIVDETVHRDPGWALLNYAFKPFGEYGFFVLVACLSIFEGVVFYKMIKKYVPQKWWTFAVFIYLFSTSLYLYSFSMLRQSFVVAAFLSLWPLIEKRRVVISLLVLLLASFIHGSGKILLPFAFWGFIPMNKKSGKLWTLIFVGLILMLYFSKDTLNDLLTIALSMSEEFERYQETYSGATGGLAIGLGFIIYMLPLILSLLFISSPKYDNNIKRLVLLSCVSFVIAPFTQIIPLIGRIGVYFGAFSVMAIPMVYGNIANKVLRYSLTSLYVLIIAYDYILFFNSPVWVKAFGGEFKTIFSVIL